MMRKRILTALFAIPLFLGFAYAGGWAFTWFTASISMIMLREFFKMIKNRGLWGYSLGYLLVAVIYYLTYWEESPVYLELLFPIFILVFCWQMLKPLKYNFADSAATFLGIVYVGGFYSYLILLRHQPNGFYILLFLFAVIWCTDSFAYFTGIFLGRHRLAPHISPKKTVEGAVGGLFGGIGGAVLIGEIFLDFSLSDLVILGLLLSAIGQLGDLIESLLKRNYGVKDSGNFLPGHGGLLDRFDSVLLSGPFLYYYLKYFLS